MALDYDEVRSAVGKSVKRAVCRFGHFKDHPEAYTPDVVPENPFPKGLAANDRFWKEVLDVVATELAQQNSAYSGLKVTVQDAIDTYRKPVSATTTLLTDRIVDGPQPSSSLIASAWGKVRSLWG